MDEVKTYWRDAAMKVIAWGTGSLIVVAGWAFSESKKFEILRATHDDQIMRAVALLLFVFTFTPSWYLGVRWIYRTHLSVGVNGTVLPWRAVRAYLFLVVACTWVLALITALL